MGVASLDACGGTCFSGRSPWECVVLGGVALGSAWPLEGCGPWECVALGGVWPLGRGVALGGNEGVWHLQSE